MEYNLIGQHSPIKQHCYILFKSLLIMKLILFFVIITTLNAFSIGLAQTVDLQVQNSTVESVFTEIRRQTGYRFIYNESALKGTARVDLNMKNAPLESVLIRLMKNQPLEYQLYKGTVVIKRKAINLDESNRQTIQQRQINGKVTDKTGNPLVGVTVSIKGSSNGTSTNQNGEYTLNIVGTGNILAFSLVGFRAEEVAIGTQTTINIDLEDEISGLDEVIVVGYGTQKRQSVTGAVSQISGSELLKAPVGNVNNLLAGRISGVVALQASGQPGADGAGLLVRGSSAKYIVDGFERSFSEIDPNEIETVSVLKDASSASVYGLDAGAVIIITTKRGKQGPSRISFTSTYGISQNALMLQMLDGPGYAYWYNKATEMDGNQPVFKYEHLEKMEQGIDGWGNTNWYDETFSTGDTRSLNLNASGGTDKLKYFAFLGNYKQNGNVNNFNNDRYNFRSNIDASIAKNLDLTFDIAGRLQKREAPLYGAGKDDFNNVPQQAIRAHPYVPKEIDGIPVSTRAASVFVSPLAASELTGYNDANSNVMQANLSLNLRIPQIEGLSLKVVGAYDVTHNSTKRFSTPYQTYVANLPTSTTDNITYNYGSDSRGNEVSLVEGFSRTTYLRTNASARYENTFGLHNISFLGLAEASKQDDNSFGAYGYGFDILELDELDFNNDPTKTRVIGGSKTARIAGFLSRVTYDYSNRFLAEMSLRYDGSHVFGGMVPGKRWSSFPAASLGWRMSEEKWFKDTFHNVDELKLRGSAGLTGRTGIDPYYYLSSLGYTNNPAVVLNGIPYQGLQTSRPGNINLSWEKTLQYNLGIDASLWQGLLGIEFDVFYKYNYDILVATNQVPDSFGGYRPGFENIGKKDQKGFEVMLSHRNRINDFSYRVGLNGTYAKRRWLSYPDAPNTPDWLKYTGKEDGLQIGFIADGIFQNQEEIDNAPIIEAARPSIGDIRYVDRNGDGVISYNQDRGFVGKSAYPKFVGGFTFDFEWKGIDLSLLLQGGLGRDVALTGVYSTGVMSHTSMTKPFYGSGNSPVYLVENSWTEQNRNAEFPRLSVTTASGNNAYSSTFWYRNGNYLRLKNLQIGYSLPNSIIKNAGISGVRIYAEGQNILTFSELTKYGIDPEQPGVSNGYYPQQRVFNLGLKLTL